MDWRRNQWSCIQNDHNLADTAACTYIVASKEDDGCEDTKHELKQNQQTTYNRINFLSLVLGIRFWIVLQDMDQYKLQFVDI